MYRAGFHFNGFISRFSIGNSDFASAVALGVRLSSRIVDVVDYAGPGNIDGGNCANMNFFLEGFILMFFPFSLLSCFLHQWFLFWVGLNGLLAAVLGKILLIFRAVIRLWFL